MDNTFQPAKKIYKKQSAECKVAYGIRELHATPIMYDSTGTQENLNENQKMKMNLDARITFEQLHGSTKDIPYTQIGNPPHYSHLFIGEGKFKYLGCDSTEHRGQRLEQDPD